MSSLLPNAVVLLALLMFGATDGETADDPAAVAATACGFGPEVRGAGLGDFLVGKHPPYDSSSLAAAQAWCCKQGSVCAGVTYHGDGAGATHHYDAMGGSAAGAANKCAPQPKFGGPNTSSWARLPCPEPPPPPPPIPPPPAPAPGWAPRWHVDPLTVRIAADQRTPLPSSASSVDIAAQLGEYEEQQLWIVAPADVDLHNVTLSFDFDGPQNDWWSYAQVGYVRAGKPLYNCSDPAHAQPSPPGIPTGKTGGYGCTRGWHADVILPVEQLSGVGIPVILRNSTQPIVLQLRVPRPPASQPGNFTGAVRVTGVAGFATPLPFTIEVPIALELWPIELPRSNESGAFTTLLSFGDYIGQSYYPQLSEHELWEAWLPLLSSYRITGDSLYVAPRPCLHPCPPRPLWLYDMMVAQNRKEGGNLMMNLEETWSWRGHTPNASAIVARLDAWLNSSGLAARPDLLEKAYLYGFDEWPETQRESLVELYAAFKQRWPHLRTMATFGWLNVSTDLPLDVWVNHYVDFYRHGWRPQQRLDWLAAGKEYYWYWSDDPWDTRRMNPSWVEVSD
jgi:hypothetical protein